MRKKKAGTAIQGVEVLDFERDCHICWMLHFVSVTPVGLQQPVSTQSRGVMGSVHVERLKVKLFAPEHRGFHLLFL